jgi:hypothetical protein
MYNLTADQASLCASVRRLAFVALLLPLAAPVRALDISARGNAMGGVMDLDARGAEAVSSCPAGLANSSGSLAGGWALDGTNNRLIMRQLMSFVTDKPGETASVDHIGDWNAEVRSVAGFAVSWAGFGFSFQHRRDWEARGASQTLAMASVNRYCYLWANTTSVSGGTITDLGYDEIAVAYGRALPVLLPDVTVAAGLSAKLLSGTRYRRFSDNRTITTGATNVEYAPQERDFSNHGLGAAVDFGLECEVGRWARAAVTVRDLGGVIYWRNSLYSNALYATGAAEMTVIRVKRDVTQHLERSILASAEGTLPALGTLLAAGYEVQSAPGTGLLRAGAEQKLGVLALRLGYAFRRSADMGGYFTGGIGLGSRRFHVDASYYYFYPRIEHRKFDDRAGMIAGSAGLTF